MPYFAYCDRNGSIGFGNSVPEGMLPIIKSRDLLKIKNIMAAKARHAYQGRGLLVPGIPEAADDDKALDALLAFRAWLSRQYPRMVAGART